MPRGRQHLELSWPRLIRQAMPEEIGSKFRLTGSKPASSRHLWPSPIRLQSGRNAMKGMSTRVSTDLWINGETAGNGRRMMGR